MSPQAKRLKAALKEIRATDGNFSLRVRTPKIKGEYQKAFCFVDKLTNEQCGKLEMLLPYASIRNMDKIDRTLVEA
ncbi:MAG: hypothetical protein ACREBJ_04295 [Nitrosotalea sp.]